MNTAFRAVIICVLLLFTFLASTAVSALPPFKANGGFQIEQLTENGWEAAGFLSYDAFFRERSLTLSAKDGPVTIRLIKFGEGAGHIDAAQINGYFPVHVKGVTDELPGRKLTLKDFDVIHSPDTPNVIEMTFPVSGTLKMAARVESQRLHKEPFRFPEQAVNDAFISFVPTTEETCLFYTDTLPGTGHPSAPTTAWAYVEDDILNVRVDFCPDNTLDGDNDYAAVHIRTPGGVKEFRVSQNQTRWGNPFFTYTPEVPWQHKVYSFRIPAADLIGVDLTGAIELALTAYGTAGPGPYAPAMVYGEQNREYMSAYHYWYTDSHTQIRLQRFSTSGAVAGSPIDVTVKDAVYKYNANLTYNSNTNQFLILWEEDVGGGSIQIARQLVSANGSIVGDVQRSAGINNKYRIAAAFSPTSNYYMTAWDENGDVYGEMLFANANSVNPGVFSIDALPGSVQSQPDIAWISQHNQFLVVWEDGIHAATSGTDISGVYLDPIGEHPGMKFSVSTHSAGQTRPQVAYEPGADHTLVVWVDYRNSGDGLNRDVFGQFLYGHDPVGNELILTNAPDDLTLARVFPAGIGRFLVIWSTANTGGNERIQGRFVTLDGAMTPIRDLSQASVSVSLGDLAGTGGPGMLMVYEVYSGTGIDISASPVLMGGVTPVLPLLLMP